VNDKVQECLAIYPKRLSIRPNPPSNHWGTYSIA